MNTTTPIMITNIPATHSLYAVLSDASRRRIFSGGLPAEVVCGYGSPTPTALRYLGESWPITGVEYVEQANDVTDAQIVTLKSAMAVAEDLPMVGVCEAALGHGPHRDAARKRCADIIAGRRAR